MRLEANADGLGRLESANAGKPMARPSTRSPFAPDRFRFFAGAARVMDGLAANHVRGRPHLDHPALTRSG